MNVIYQLITYVYNGYKHVYTSSYVSTKIPKSVLIAFFVLFYGIYIFIYNKTDRSELLLIDYSLRHPTHTIRFVWEFLKSGQN